MLRVLTPRKSTDLLLEVRSHKASGPYVCAFVGINGVGKSTSLAKVCYYLKSHGVKVMIAACDTFRCVQRRSPHPSPSRRRFLAFSRRDPSPLTSLLSACLPILPLATTAARSGAVEQLRSHAACLGVPLFERGYLKDPGEVARAAIAEAKALR